MIFRTVKIAMKKIYLTRWCIRNETGKRVRYIFRRQSFHWSAGEGDFFRLCSIIWPKNGRYKIGITIGCCPIILNKVNSSPNPSISTEIKTHTEKKRERELKNHLCVNLIAFNIWRSEGIERSQMTYVSEAAIYHCLFFSLSLFFCFFCSTFLFFFSVVFCYPSAIIGIE